MADPSKLQLDKLSPLGRWIFETGSKYNVTNTSLTALNVEPEADISYLLGDRYLDFSLCILFALLFPVIRSLLRRLVYEVRPMPVTDSAIARMGPLARQRSLCACEQQLSAAMYLSVQPWGRWAIFSNKVPKQLDEAQQTKLRKWNESAWKMTVYIAFTSLALWVCWGEVSTEWPDCMCSGSFEGGPCIQLRCAEPTAPANQHGPRAWAPVYYMNAQLRC